MAKKKKKTIKKYKNYVIKWISYVIFGFCLKNNLLGNIK